MPAAKKTPARPARNASGTRDRILETARVCFSQRSYENVGVREIAAGAGVDAALVNRYFGTKQGLFDAVITGAFHVQERLPIALDDLGAFLVKDILDDAAEVNGFNPLRLLLLASTSPETAAKVAASFHAEFVQPLARQLRGRDTEQRAALIGAYVIGLATMRHLLQSPPLQGSAQRKSAALVGAAIQACVQA